jgi:hypothetical protein
MAPGAANRTGRAHPHMLRPSLPAAYPPISQPVGTRKLGAGPIPTTGQIGPISPFAIPLNPPLSEGAFTPMSYLSACRRHGIGSVRERCWGLFMGGGLILPRGRPLVTLPPTSGRVNSGPGKLQRTTNNLRADPNESSRQAPRQRAAAAPWPRCGRAGPGRNWCGPAGAPLQRREG